jgi:hypothetical protein
MVDFYSSLSLSVKYFLFFIKLHLSYILSIRRINKLNINIISSTIKSCFIFRLVRIRRALFRLQLHLHFSVRIDESEVHYADLKCYQLRKNLIFAASSEV